MDKKNPSDKLLTGTQKEYRQQLGCNVLTTPNPNLINSSKLTKRYEDIYLLPSEIEKGFSKEEHNIMKRDKASFKHLNWHFRHMKTLKKQNLCKFINDQEREHEIENEKRKKLKEKQRKKMKSKKEKKLSFVAEAFEPDLEHYQRFKSTYKRDRDKRSAAELDYASIKTESPSLFSINLMEEKIKNSLRRNNVYREHKMIKTSNIIKHLQIMEQIKQLLKDKYQGYYDKIKEKERLLSELHD